MSRFCRVDGAAIARQCAAPGRSDARGIRGSSAFAGVRVFAGGLAGIAAVLVALLGVGASTAVADSCPNAQFLTGYSAHLPDCRAYELVSPSGGRPYLSSDNHVSFTRAASTGNGIAWFSSYPIPGASSDGDYYLTTRALDGWTTQGVIPPQSPFSSDLFACEPSMSFSLDLSLGVLSDGFDAQGDGTGGSCGADDPTLVPNERQGSRNLFLHSSSGGAYQLVDVAPLGVGPSNSEFQAGSSDFSHLVFEDEAALTPGAASGINIYEWAGGSVHLVSVLPDGTPVSATVANPATYDGPGASGVGPGSFAGNAPFTGAVSSDGSRVFFQANDNLYMRQNPTQPQSAISAGVCTDAEDACTVQVDASQSGGSGGGGTFQWGSSDGSHVFFTDDASANLTGDTVPGSGANLYQYDVTSGKLTDLTPASNAMVQGVSGMSSDGSYVYFVADAALASGATPGQPNLYVHHAGTTTFVATLSANSDSGDWDVSGFLMANVAPDGRYIAFNSVNSLTGYDNVEQSTGQPDTEIYRYDATTGKLSCASCDPSGAPPIGPAALPGREQMANTDAAGYLQRNLSADGRVFFDSPDPLVANASNGQSNVYESEPDGVGGCAQANGCLYLISSGTSAAGSFFYDASTSGDDVFFITDQNLVGDGTDSSGMGIYDARVGGGFAPPAPGAPSCTEGTCQAAVPSLPQAPTAATVAFTGPGNASSNTTPTTGKVKVLHRVVQGRSFMLTVSVPAKGHLTISGKDVVHVSRSVEHAGRYRIKVRLNATGKHRLKRRRTLKVDLRVSYRSNDGRASAASVSLTAKARRAR